MLRSLRIRDFQSLRDVSLDLGRLTVIVGSTNSGKSAVVRALQAAFFNQSGGEFVRRDAAEAVVTIDCEAFQLEWRKPRRGGAQYTLDGSVMTRAGRDAPVVVEDATGVREISGEGFRARVQVDAQFDEPFLLAGTGGQAARLLARVSKLDVLVTAQVLARRDRERTHRAGAEAASQASELAERLAAQPDYEALLMRWRLLCSEWGIVAEKRSRLEVAAEQVRRLRGLQAMQARWDAARLPELAAALPAPESLTEIGQECAVWSDLRTRTGRTTIDLHAATGRLSVLETELHKALAELEICPVCQRPMKESREPAR